MKKKLAKAVLVLAGVVTLTACGANGNEASSNTEVSTSEATSENSAENNTENSTEAESTEENTEESTEETVESSAEEVNVTEESKETEATEETVAEEEAEGTVTAMCKIGDYIAYSNDIAQVPLETVDGEEFGNVKMDMVLGEAIYVAKDLITVKATLNDDGYGYYTLVDYECFDLDGKSLGKTSPKELNYMAINANDEMKALVDESEKISGDVKLSSLEMGKKYYVEDAIKLTNDSGKALKVTEYSIDSWGDVSDDDEFITAKNFTKDYVDGSASNTGVIYSAVVVFSEATPEEIMDDCFDSDILRVSEMTKGEEVSSFAYKFIYNDTKSKVTMKDSSGATIALEAGEFVGMSWIDLDELSYE